MIWDVLFEEEGMALNGFEVVVVGLFGELDGLVYEDEVRVKTVLFFLSWASTL